MKRILSYFVVAIIGIVAGMVLCRQINHCRDTTKMVQTDTVVYRDTIREYYPVETERMVVDTMRIVVRDTIRMKDTLYMQIPLEKKLYASDEYYAEVSGYKPKLDYIEVYPKTVYVTTEKITPVRSKNSIGLGIETSYLNTLSIPIYLEYERMLHKNIGIYGQIAYD